MQALASLNNKKTRPSENLEAQMLDGPNIQFAL